MIPDNNSYPLFEANQVLSAAHLNTLATRLDEQSRLTRATLHGIGIVCGMEVSMTKSSGKATISISEGYGVTSEGYPVIIGDAGFKADRCRALEIRDGYKPLLLDDMDEAEKLLELLDSSHENYDEGTEINADDATDMAVVLYVELLETSLKTCTPGSCDDKGKKVTVNLRKLLVPTAYLDTLHNEVAEEIEKDAKGDFFPNLAARLDLTDIRMPRIDVPATALTDAESIVAAYKKILIDPIDGADKSLFKHISETLDAARSAYTPLLDDPGKEFSSDLGKMESDFLNPQNNRAAAFQYHYDFLNDLIRAYDEFRTKAFEMTALCNPPSQLYARHLELGELKPASDDRPSAEAGILSYRNHFRPSLALGELKVRREEVQSLYNRLRAMVANFDLPVYDGSKNPDENIRITPSLPANAPLSQRAIPCYYKPGADLLETWDFAKTAAGRSHLNCGSQIDGDDSINWSLDKCGFFRIEGHTGLDADKALEALQKKIATYRLPFDVLVLKTETPPDNLDDEELQSYLTEFLKKHPGIEHTSGVMPGGTFVMVCNKAGSTSGSPYNAVLSKIGSNAIVADFTLPYRIVETLKPADISVGECQYTWIDSVRHLNNITIRNYHKQAANEAEASRLATNYIVRIRKYEIQGANLLGSGSVDVAVALTDLKRYGHAAIMEKLNQTFPLGAVFDHSAESGNVLIRTVRGQRFRIELEGVQGNRIRYAYTETGMYRYQNGDWEQIDGAKPESSCRMIATDYDKKVYRWIQKTFKPSGTKSRIKRPTVQEIIRWEKMALKRARRYKSAVKLPIYKTVLSGLASTIRSIDPAAKIVLVGSWSNGSWLSRIESENTRSFSSASQLNTFRTLNQKVTGRTGFSGIDLLIESTYAITPDMIPVICGYPITIYKGKKDAQKGLEL
ncbi:MAG TPA: hypothetical protein ENL01_05160 [Chlorobaculum parvum]|uniref:Uncharacterized protein n=1 Tax=Chlorobaculum parvum TaxID=274539 RepID=A0A7C5HQ15_9CHLB|nr:hypothetical protein [Chlorobaculum parvum]